MAAMESTSAGACPLCGGPNDCAIARGEDKCWCFDEIFPPNLFERMPPEDEGKVCVCRNCVADARNTGS
jgi:hypothetical protein